MHTSIIIINGWDFIISIYSRYLAFATIIIALTFYHTSPAQGIPNLPLKISMIYLLMPAIVTGVQKRSI